MYILVEARIYSQTADFKSLSTVATRPDHQSSRTCWHCDIFLIPKTIAVCEIKKKSRLKMHCETTRNFSSESSEKEDSSLCSWIYCMVIRFVR